jgi:pantoate--beta-alanine ligase
VTVVVRSRAEFLSARAQVKPGAQVGAVLTMGALHDGHEALMDAARASNDVVLATVFVNPAQFGPNEDLSRYPRSLDDDLVRCERAGVDLVWTPSVADVYPEPVQVRLSAGPLGGQLEGASRPGHFDGMLLVVMKLLHLLAPDATYFGEKDYQQLTLVRAMVADLELPVDIVGVPTVREPDGLALSSRNVYLTAEQRALATALSRALFAGRDAGAQGADAVLRAATQILAGVDVDYLALRDLQLRPAPTQGAARLLVAARLGSTRLIDNVALELAAEA